MFMTELIETLCTLSWVIIIRNFLLSVYEGWIIGVLARTGGSKIDRVYKQIILLQAAGSNLHAR